MKQLDSRAKGMIILYYKENKSAHEIGIIYNVTDERVRHLLGQSVKKLIGIKSINRKRSEQILRAIAE
jgi:DNA-directed RNA polymerase specialized sigma subunit